MEDVGAIRRLLALDSQEKNRTESMRLRRLIWRGLRLRCPVCGRGRMFRGYFGINQRCSECGLKFQREPGFFLGSIYFNYGLTALVVAVAYPVLLFNNVLGDQVLAPTSLAFVVLFPLWFFRYARSLWAAFDQFIDPREAEENDSAASAGVQ